MTQAFKMFSNRSIIGELQLPHAISLLRVDLVFQRVVATVIHLQLCIAAAFPLEDRCDVAWQYMTLDS